MLTLPTHQCSLHLTHNQHRSYYQTVAAYLSEADYDDEELTAAERAEAHAADELWELQWYPTTPVGFLKLAAPTLPALLAKVRAHSGWITVKTASFG